jgi:Uma2 family endonuclease
MDVVETRVGMPLDQFLEESSRQRFELINGEKVLLMPNVYDHIMLVKLIYDLIYEFLREHRIGHVFSEATFVLPDRSDPNWVRGSRIPDVMFVSHEKIQEYIASPLSGTRRPFAVIPELAIEVISPTDNFGDVLDKSLLYIRDGVRLVWVIDQDHRRVVEFTAAGSTEYYSGEDTLTGGEVLPGFEIKLSALFGV